MAAALRLFVGMFPPAEAARTVHAQVRRALAGTATRIVPAAEIHVTLHFLGATDEDRVPDLAHALGRELAALSGPDLTIRGAGGFPDESSARVLWLGLIEKAGAQGRLAALARAARAAASAAGLPGEEEEPWRAHLTVARGSRGKVRLPEAFRDLSLAVPWSPAEVLLVESRPGAIGAERFPVLASFRIQPESA